MSEVPLYCRFRVSAKFHKDALLQLASYRSPVLAFSSKSDADKCVLPPCIVDFGLVLYIYLCICIYGSCMYIFVYMYLNFTKTLYRTTAPSWPSPPRTLRTSASRLPVQGYLAHKKPPHPRTLQ